MTNYPDNKRRRDVRGLKKQQLIMREFTCPACGESAGTEIQGWAELRCYCGRRMKEDKQSKPKGGYVYLATDGIAYKIGKTEKVKQRMRGLAYDNGCPIEHVCSVSISRPHKLEAKLHREFAEKRLSRGSHIEWFDLSDQDVAYIKELFGQTAGA
jgi:hypothetical protein